MTQLLFVESTFSDSMTARTGGGGNRMLTHGMKLPSFQFILSLFQSRNAPPQSELPTFRIRQEAWKG